MYVRFTPQSGQSADMLACQLSAISGCEQSQQASPLFDHLVGGDEQARTACATSNVRGAGDHALGCAAAGPARIFLACCGSDNLLAKNQNLRLAAHIGLEQSEFSPLDDLARPLRRWLRVARFS
jgi:hypothetical protein